MSWWNSKVRAVGKGDSYIRLTPNPGFSLRFPLCPRLTWSIHKGWRRHELSAISRQSLKADS